MPGHATAWFVGYPDLASGPGPYHIERDWGIFNPAMDPTRESTYKFLDTFIGEMTGLFPDSYFHIGGDECNGKEWDANPRIQQFMKAHAIKDNAALQAYFTGQSAEDRCRAQENHGWVGTRFCSPALRKTSSSSPGAVRSSLARRCEGAIAPCCRLATISILNQSAAEHYAADPEGRRADDAEPAKRERHPGRGG